MKVLGILIMMCNIFFTKKTRFLKIAHLNSGLSNKRPQRLFLSYNKCLCVNSRPASNRAPAANRPNMVHKVVTCLRLYYTVIEDDSSQLLSSKKSFFSPFVAFGNDNCLNLQHQLLQKESSSKH